jgi:uncharacterized protein YutE (UPF0331/DUF86 family)
VPDDVVVQKLASIDRCLRAIRDYIAGDLDRLLSSPLAERMRRMVGFRNVAVHEYRRLDPAVVRTIVEHRLGDFEDLCRELSATS